MESDYLQDLKWIKNEIRNLLPRQKIDNLDKAIEFINAEMSEELEALKDAEEVRKSDQEDYQSRNN